MNKNQHIPPGFKQSPLGPIPYDWELWKISDFTSSTAGGTPSTSIDEYWGGEIKWMSSGELNLKRVYEVEGRITELGLKNSSTRILPERCVLVGLAGQGKTRGTVAMNMIQLCTNQSVAAILPSDKFIEEYLYYNLDFRYEELRQLSTGEGGRGGLNLNIINSIRVPLPPLPEQTAIANLLSTWDKTIETTQRLIAQKELRKKWLMQVLLTRKKRIKEFNEEWETYPLGSLGNTYNGLTGKFKEDFGFGKPYIPYLNIFNNSKIDSANYDLVNIRSEEKQNKVEYGDILFTVSSETPDEVGMASVFLDETDEIYLNSFCFGFRLFDFNTLLPQFSCYFFRGEIFRKEILKLSQGATRFNLSKNNLLNLNICLPSIKEQHIISTMLFSADKEIQLLRSKIGKLKEQKKGLMQVLLTGKKRIKYDV